MSKRMFPIIWEHNLLLKTHLISCVHHKNKNSGFGVYYDIIKHKKYKVQSSATSDLWLIPWQIVSEGMYSGVSGFLRIKYKAIFHFCMVWIPLFSRFVYKAPYLPNITGLIQGTYFFSPPTVTGPLSEQQIAYVSRETLQVLELSVMWWVMWVRSNLGGFAVLRIQSCKYTVFNSNVLKANCILSLCEEAA